MSGRVDVRALVLFGASGVLHSQKLEDVPKFFAERLLIIREALRSEENHLGVRVLFRVAAQDLILS